MNDAEAMAMLKATADNLGATSVQVTKGAISFKLGACQFAPSSTHAFDRVEIKPCLLAQRAHRTSWRPVVGERVMYIYGEEAGIFTIKKVDDKGLVWFKENKIRTCRGWTLRISKKNLLDAIKQAMGNYSGIILGTCLFKPTKEFYWEYRHKNLPKYKRMIEEYIAEYRKMP